MKSPASSPHAGFACFSGSAIRYAARRLPTNLLPPVRVVPFALDVADPASITAAAQKFSEQADRLGVLVNNAAILEDDALTAAGVSELTPELTTRLAGEGVLLPALEVLGSGAALSGIVLAASAVFII